MVQSQDCPGGPYKSLADILADPVSTTRCLIDFGGAAEDAVKRSNDDKASARRVLHPEKPKQGFSTAKGKATLTDRLPAFLRAHKGSAKRLKFNDGYCSGTAVHPHTLLTATHCMDGSILLQVDGRSVKVLEQTDDWKDHTLVTVDSTFPEWSTIVERMPQQGETVTYWGNPRGRTDMYRKGYVSGYCNAPTECMDVGPIRTVTVTGQTYMLELPGAHGDSGAGVFDTNGNVIGVISGIWPIGDSLVTMVGWPLNFAPETLRGMK